MWWERGEELGKKKEGKERQKGAKRKEKSTLLTLIMNLTSCEYFLSETNSGSPHIPVLQIDYLLSYQTSLL